MKMEKASDQYFLGYKINYKWGGVKFTPPPMQKEQALSNCMLMFRAMTDFAYNLSLVQVQKKTYELQLILQLTLATFLALYF